MEHRKKKKKWKKKRAHKKKGGGEHSPIKVPDIGNKGHGGRETPKRRKGSPKKASDSPLIENRPMWGKLGRGKRNGRGKGGGREGPPRGVPHS